MIIRANVNEVLLKSASSQETSTMPRASRIRDAAVVVAGMIGALALGVVARLWMRLISVNPEFTWSGTIGIVTGFAIFGLTQSLSALSHRRRWRPWPARLTRFFGFVGMMPLFIAAGGQMMPTVVFGGLGSWRVRQPRAAQIVCLVVAALPVVFIGRGIIEDFGWSFRSLAGISGLVAIYSIIVGATRATMSRPAKEWRTPRSHS